MTTHPSADTEGAMTRREVAQKLNVSVRHVDRTMENGELPYFKVGASVRFRPADVAAFIEKRMNAHAVAGDVADRIAELVASAPPLTDEQRTRLAELLRPARAS